MIETYLISMEIRDPVHGSLDIPSWAEPLIDSPPLQRLRRIRALGFAEQGYPGATHHRFLHSLGVFWLGKGLLSQFQQRGQLNHFSEKTQEGLIRLAAISSLCHDLGHTPFSHALEEFLPKHTSHEEISLRLTEKYILPLAKSCLEPYGIDPTWILWVMGKNPAKIMIDGLDVLPLLRSLLWGECDVDRMDYLLRDTYFCGVSYGNFDLKWMFSHLKPTVMDNRLELALHERGLGSFEDFLLSRLHMFQLVYLHHAGVGAEFAAKKILQETHFTFPADLDEYLLWDDYRMLSFLENAKVPAQNFFPKGYKVLLEEPTPIDPALISLLNCEYIHISSTVKLAKHDPSLFIETAHGKLMKPGERTKLFEKYREPVFIDRIYIPRQTSQAETDRLKALIRSYFRVNQGKL